jgi:putative membrane protein
MKTSLLPFLTSLSLLATPWALPATAAERAVLAVPSVAASDDLFLTSAASAGTGEIQYSEHVRDRTEREPVKTFATAMVNDSKEMDRQLKDLANKVKVKLPGELTPKQQSTFDDLKNANSGDSDRMYLETMLADHQTAVAAFEKASSESRNPDVKAFASANLPHIKAHLRKTEEIAKLLGFMNPK